MATFKRLAWVSAPCSQRREVPDGGLAEPFEQCDTTAGCFVAERSRVMSPIRSFLVAALLMGSAIPAAHADPVFTIGGTYTVSGTNMPDNFTQTGIVLDQTTKTIDSGALTVTEAITPVGYNDAFIVFEIASANGGQLAGNLGSGWALAISNIPINGTGTFSNPFIYFAHDGTPYSPLSAASGFGVETNPLTNSGQVFDFLGFTPNTVTGQFGLNVYTTAYNFLDTIGVDTAAANQVYFGAEIALDIAEPGTLAVLGLGLLGTLYVRRGPYATPSNIAFK